MLTRWFLLGCTLPFCLGVSCSIDFDDDSPAYVQLDLATATMTISGTTESDTVSVRATIEHDGDPVELQNGQAVLVNSMELSGPNSDDEYTRTIDKASAYTVRVVEPTLGVQNTQVVPPSNFSITQPEAGGEVSLAGGFELRWSNADPGLNVTVKLSQTLGTQREKTLGPIASDAGSLTITSADLEAFRQGATIAIEVIRTATTTDVAGFAEGSTAKVSLSNTTSVVPAP